MIGLLITSLQLIIFLVLPAYLIRLSTRYKVNQVFSDIVICYGIGMVLGNLKMIALSVTETTYTVESVNQVSIAASRYLAFGSVLIAIPLLLMVNNVTDWIKYTGKIVPVFFLGVLSTVVVTLALGYFMRESLPNAPTVAGMMTGVYIGGTPNMVAISKALNADEHLFLILNATDTICSGLYFFFLISFGKLIIRKLFPAFVSRSNPLEEAASEEDITKHPFPPSSWSWRTFQPLVIATGISCCIVFIGLVPAVFFADPLGEPNQALLILVITSGGIALSFVPFLRTLPGVFNYAQYLLLIFGLAAGYLTDFSQLADVGKSYLLFNVYVILGIITVHGLLSRLFRSDGDSFMITSTACIMGPPFVAQVASALNNKELLPAGIALSLLGFGLANYAGMLVAWIIGTF
ncbi:MAG: DUF819 family protein [Cyclobacteriaceae bacterium]|nr:DUF819 family protein [Cyclobacteriaceae bacterium]